jgi:hypothetical protein
MNLNDPNEMYEHLKSKSLPDLCKEIAQIEGTISKPLIARLIIEERQMQEKFKYEKEQVQIQHKLNIELTKKQLRWMKFAAILNAIALLGAVLLGWYLQEWKSQSIPAKSTQQSIQSQTESSPSTILVPHPERKNDKDTLQPPRKEEKHR